MLTTKQRLGIYKYFKSLGKQPKYINVGDCSEEIQAIAVNSLFYLRLIPPYELQTKKIEDLSWSQCDKLLEIWWINKNFIHLPIK